MVGVKKIVAHDIEVMDKVRELIRSYNVVKISYKGSHAHRKARLRSGEVLVSAWSKKRRRT